ncbi:Kelch-like protein 20, partial [Geodia barretti]
MIRGSATTDGRFAYFTPSDSNSVYQYESSPEKWEELPSCPCSNSGLVIIDRELTAVGGLDGFRHINKLYTLRQRKWVEKYPPMNTAHSYTAVVTTSDGDYLIAIGGSVGDGWTATVQLLQVKARRWYQLTDLPQPLPLPSATIFGDQLNVIGRDANGYSCSLAALPSSDQPITSPLTLSWKPLPPLPVKNSTAATLCGRLVLIGGLRRSAVNSIHQLVDGQWVEIGSMT